jgi:general secretion pathway protein K
VRLRDRIWREQRKKRSQRGFVLLVVLSVLGILAVVAAGFAQVARNHMRLAAVASEGARAEALADAGVHIVVLDLVATRGAQSSARRFALDATPLACSIDGDGAVLTLTVQDEAGKVDLNIATPPLLRALVLGLGLSGGESAVDAILDYRDEDDNRRIAGAERAEYLAAGRSHGPRNGPFLAVEELAGVLGLTQADADRLRPFVTIHSGLAAIDANVAPKALVDILARGLREGGGPSLLEGGPAVDDLATMSPLGSQLPPQFLGASTRRAFSVRSQARTAAGATFVREAIVEFVAPTSPAFALRRWYRGSAATPAPSSAAEALPRC